MGKHSETSGAGRPKTGTGHRQGHGPKAQRGQSSQLTSGGATIWSETAKLWGVLSGKKKS